ncbi:MAG: tRNA uridine-5-carboxymethylaminomethyl(34) synthesis GTPase MnmE [Rhodothermales bacterium]|nr:tRNA uridine-5-carboxymethylaminomethyl(34) synthesis GTPase MnmE [Rhodothermales bacterium]
MMAPDTIAAPATARGRAALSIIRLSGPEARSIAARCFVGADLGSAPSHTAHFGRIVNGDVTVDQVVATVFHNPRSSTGEDIVEITCHGGDFAPQLVLDALLANGARMAEPGEFTLRAFLNGKMDLAQAEAVADIIHATSTSAHRVSVSHLEGHYSKLIEKLRMELIDLGAMLELELDFGEEDVEFADRQRLYALLSNASALLAELVTSYRTGARLRDGINVIIAGKPNAGKSTLLNALVGKDRAIVSEIPGTTRDEIEASVEIQGLPFRFRDTAGLRQTTDVVEEEGVRRARKSMQNADVLLYVFDSTKGLDVAELDELVAAGLAVELIILIANKSDLHAERPHDPAQFTREPYTIIALSALHAVDDEEEIKPLVARLTGIVTDAIASSDSSRVVTNLRHKDHLARAKEAVDNCVSALDTGKSGDLVSIELRHALAELGAITGQITNEDILDSIFSRFCIGK